MIQGRFKTVFGAAGVCGLAAVAAENVSVTVKGSDAVSMRPNILLILADDLGYADIGVHGCEDIDTPVLDRLAHDGILFTDAYVTHPTCSPSRAALLTGRHQLRFGFVSNPDYIIPNYPEAPLGMPLSEITIAQVLKGAGYRTGLVGKWHLGKPKAHHPLRFGFDSFYGILGAQHWFFDVNMHSGTFNGVLRDYEFVIEPEYLTYGFAREAVDFIRAGDPRPWFMFLSFTAPHTPLMADTWKPGDPMSNHGPSDDPAENRLVYKNMVEAMDQSIGRVLDAVEQKGQSGNTLVIFLSDNGGTKITGAYDNGPLRDWKGSIWEGGVRVPFIARWPGVIPPGTRSAQVISSLDFMPTFAEVAGTRPPEDRVLDGISLLPFFADPAAQQTRTLFWEDGRGRLAIRQGSWKAYLETRGGMALYNLADDLSETTDLAARHPERTERFRTEMTAWKQQMPQAMWTRLPPPDWEGWRKQMGNFDWDE